MTQPPVSGHWRKSGNSEKRKRKRADSKRGSIRYGKEPRHKAEIHHSWTWATFQNFWMCQLKRLSTAISSWTVSLKYKNRQSKPNTTGPWAVTLSWRKLKGGCPGELSEGRGMSWERLEEGMSSEELSGEYPDPHAVLQVSTCSGYDSCHPG